MADAETERVETEQAEETEGAATEPTELDVACRILSESTSAFEKLTAEHVDATLIGGLAAARSSLLATIARAARSLRGMLP